MRNHPDNAALIQAMFESKLNHSSQPRDPQGNYWPLPELKYRLDSIDDVSDTAFEDGDTIVMTHDDDYIPDHGRKRRHDGGVPFDAFQLYRVTAKDGKVIKTVELTRAFWKLGEFAIYGKMTNDLGRMFYQLINKIAHRSNWRGYTYRDSLELLAIEYLCRYALKFDHRNALQNPTGYLNQQIDNAFKREVQKQQKHEHYENALMAQHLGASTGFHDRY